MALLAASGGDTVKVFDDSVETGDPCTLSYTPSPGCQVNSVKWNHTNLVLASAGEDKKISLWRKSGQSMGTVFTGTDSVDNIEESMLSIDFSKVSSRYICSGGTGQVVRIWDLQSRRCIKWLKGHTNTITGAMYNCKDEHLASISVGGDLVVHNTVSGARSELKDPNSQVLRVLDYSRMNRHLLVTAGDDGTVLLWDTTGRSPKVSWLKQHSAPTAGVSFSPSNDKIIASVGLDRKLYTYDSGSKRPSSCITYEAPFSCFAYKDDGFVLAAGTSNGRVVFYDVRRKPQPLKVLRAYSSSEAITSLSWQRSEAVTVNESTCTAKVALLGCAVKDSVFMPDPLPRATSSISDSILLSGLGFAGSRSGHSDQMSFTATSGVTGASTLNLKSVDDSPLRSYLQRSGPLAKLHTPRSSYNFLDDMEVFSPLVTVQSVTPSLNMLRSDHRGDKKDNLAFDKNPASLQFASSSKRFSFRDGADEHSKFEWKSRSPSYQLPEDTKSSFALLGSSTPKASTESEDTVTTPPEAWGCEKVSDRYNHLKVPSRLAALTSSSVTSESTFSGYRDLSSSLHQTSLSSLTDTNLSYENNRTRDVGSNLSMPGQASSSSLLTLGTKSLQTATSHDSSRPASLDLPRRFSTYAERISTTSSLSDGTSVSIGSPKIKKHGAETLDGLLGGFLSRVERAAAMEPATLPTANEGIFQPSKASQPDPHQGSNFTIQLFQRTLEETLDSFKKSIHEDMRNIHIEIIRQFHMHETEMSNVLSSIRENQSELMKEIKSLRKENEELRQML